ncbi:hypothetical protein TVAG_321040 [Trichomonas vaginalis G3]|uniref:Uncharacterized protein n=1 Tax=Trichomonas vaginalis (strain ATCC PRA-98 / G3) TaxID=412133 RepID=A2F812_TRIV3|nr:hypothetical protein TVAGG3_0383970 [Trichomonas vaginalis G3]EAX98944.1 hypothetical protein TVAG_321040 [Trichomonas vaginalis G3]KAI5533490.1 hypothetical protein TVAGG3_0383970 [Trichomonas vaginalis G3]|eukprot:XP_001311874.1 hypothetical protein [Trichomonas vaginalis G3]
MFPNDQFNRGYQHDRMTRFASNVDRPIESRPRRDFPMRSQSTRIEPSSPREIPMQRKTSTIPPIVNFDLSQRESNIECEILPTDVSIDDDDPLKKIIQMQNAISEKFINTIESSCKVITAATEIINEMPKFSKPYQNAQHTGNDLESRIQYVQSIEDGADLNLEEILK